MNAKALIALSFATAMLLSHAQSLADDTLPTLTLHEVVNEVSGTESDPRTIYRSGRLEDDCCEAYLMMHNDSYSSFSMSFEVGPTSMYVTFFRQFGSGNQQQEFTYYPCFDPLCGCVPDPCGVTMPMITDGEAQTLLLEPGYYTFYQSSANAYNRIEMWWTPNSTGPVSPIGACCLTDQCIRTTSSFCEEVGGVFGGAEVNCDEVSCADYPSGSGACCISDSCISTTLDDCYIANGVFSGFGTDCDDDLCPFLCDSDVNGDGEVSTNDLLTVIANWGPCP
jgi:hypothetical protein